MSLNKGVKITVFKGKTSRYYRLIHPHPKKCMSLKLRHVLKQTEKNLGLKIIKKSGSFQNIGFITLRGFFFGNFFKSIHIKLS